MSNLISNPSKIASKVRKCYPDLVSCLIRFEASFRGKYTCFESYNMKTILNFQFQLVKNEICVISVLSLNLQKLFFLRKNHAYLFYCNNINQRCKRVAIPPSYNKCGTEFTIVLCNSPMQIYKNFINIAKVFLNVYPACVNLLNR